MTTACQVDSEGQYYNYKSDVSCSKDEDCKKCYKMFDLAVDQSCSNATGRCVGFNVSSMIAVTAQSFFAPLLQKHLRDPPSELFTRAVRSLIDQCIVDNPGLRPSVIEVREIAILNA